MEPKWLQPKAHMKKPLQNTHLCTSTLVRTYISILHFVLHNLQFTRISTNFSFSATLLFFNLDCFGLSSRVMEISLGRCLPYLQCKGTTWPVVLKVPRSAMSIFTNHIVSSRYFFFLPKYSCQPSSFIRYMPQLYDERLVCDDTVGGCSLVKRN